MITKNKLMLIYLSTGFFVLPPLEHTDGFSCAPNLAVTSHFFHRSPRNSFQFFSQHPLNHQYSTNTMSTEEPPQIVIPARTPKVTSKSSKSVKNVPPKVIAEIKFAIAFACYDSPLIKNGTENMTDVMKMKVLYDHCVGDPTDLEAITFTHKFMNGIGKFGGIFTTEASHDNESIIQIMNKTLHRSDKINVYIGAESLQLSDIDYSTEVSASLLSKGNSKAKTETNIGRSLLRHAGVVQKNCRKMMTIVKNGKSPFKDEDSLPSGKHWENYAKWCNDAFWREEQGFPIFEIEGNAGTCAL